MSKNDYQLIDCGGERRLERFGPYLLDRPAPQAFWRRSLGKEDWEAADAVYQRSSKGGGDWEYRRKLPERWTMEMEGLTLILGATGFGHLGVFPEQLDNWRLMDRRIRAFDGEFELINLFGYTGAAALVASKAGALVTHVDASKGIVAWARENAAANQLHNRPIRWIVEDTVKYLHREHKRGRRYQGLVLDPPTFGRGNKGEVWKIEEDLPELLDACRAVMADDVDFLLLSTYSPKFTPRVLVNVLDDSLGDLGGSIDGAEMILPEQNRGRGMPNGVTANWLARA